MLDRGLDETSDVAGDGGREYPTPTVRHEGNTTVIDNLSSVADDLDRSIDQIATFLQDELGTNGSVDENGRANLTGQFKPVRVERAVEAYIDTHVICPECGLPDTELVDENGVTLRRCKACGARSPTGN